MRKPYTPQKLVKLLGKQIVVTRVESSDLLYAGELESISLDSICVNGYNLLYSTIEHIEVKK